MAKINLAQQLATTLEQAGIKRIWGLTGDSLNGLTDALRTMDSIEWMHVRHEEVAAFAAGAEAATLGHGNVEHDLDVTGPVARVGEDKNGVNDNVGKVSLTGVGVLLRSELAEGSGSRVVLDNIARGDNILEAVALSDVAALLTLTTDNKDGTVLLSHLPHGSVTADELTRLDVALKLTGKVTASLLFSFTTTVGEEDVRPIRGVLVYKVQHPGKSHDALYYVDLPRINLVMWIVTAYCG